LNADLSQAEREQVMKRIRDEDVRFLVCTDVAARGIDISHLTHVINFDFPEASEQYVHRTGRTGRAGRVGTAISLINPGSIGDLYYLRLKYKIQPQERHLPTRQELRTRQEADVIASLSLKLSAAPLSETHRQLARRLLASEGAENLVAGLLRELLGNPEAAQEAASAQRRAERPRPALRPPGPSEGANKRRVPAAGLRWENDAGANRERGGHRARGRAARTGHLFRYEVHDANGVDTNAPSGTDATLPRAGMEATQPELPLVSVGSDDHGRADDAGSSDRHGSDRHDSDRHSSDRHSSDRHSSDRHGPPPPRARTHESEHASDEIQGSYVNLFFGVGKRDGASSKDLEDALNSAGVSQPDLGRIQVKHGHSLVQVAAHVQQQVIARLNGTTICGREALVEPARRRE
jgi:ATP-dependent RNA helicase DeaD